MNRHAVRRARERYGVELTIDDLRAIEMMIACDSPGTIFVRRDKDFHYLVHYQGEWLAAVVKKNGALITFLPRHCAAIPAGKMTNGPDAVAAVSRANALVGDEVIAIHASNIGVEPGQCRTAMTGRTSAPGRVN